MKKIFAVLLAAILCLAAAVPAFAEGGFADEYYRCTDDADQMVYSSWAYTNNALDEIANRQSFDVTCSIISGLDGKTMEQYAADLYAENLYGYGDGKDGVLLLVDTESGEWYIYTSGTGTEIFDENRIAAIGEDIKDDLSAEEYYGAFITYANLCDKYIDEGVSAEAEQPAEAVPEVSEPIAAEPENSYEYEEASSSKISPLPLIYLPICLVIGIIIALVVVGSMKASMKSVHMQATANTYTKDGSFNLTDSSDIFLYREVESTPRPKNNDSDGN